MKKREGLENFARVYSKEKSELGEGRIGLGVPNLKFRRKLVKALLGQGKWPAAEIPLDRRKGGEGSWEGVLLC